MSCVVPQAEDPTGRFWLSYMLVGPPRSDSAANQSIRALLVAGSEVRQRAGGQAACRWHRGL